MTKAPLKCQNKACPNADSTNDNNFRGEKAGNGPERIYCKRCGAEVKPGDALLQGAPNRPLKSGEQSPQAENGNATNLPASEEKGY